MRLILSLVFCFISVIAVAKSPMCSPTGGEGGMVEPQLHRNADDRIQVVCIEGDVTTYRYATPDEVKMFAAPPPSEPDAQNTFDIK